MSRFRKKRIQPNVSLFPFLAVLICTLGVLIIMLVLAVKSADVSAAQKKAEADDQAAEKIEAARMNLELEKYRTEAIEGIRHDVVDRIARSRENRSYLQGDVRKTEDKLKAAVARLKSIEVSIAEVKTKSDKPVDQTKLDAIRSRIDAKKLEIARAKKKLEAKSKEVKTVGPSRYSLLPFHGAGGTFRRPIYVECLADSIRLQPLDITIKMSDFALPIRPGNPLDAALLAIREYWQQNDVAGEQGAPYPLLVVRPDGAETFVLARRAMQSWTDEFGYELVDDEKDLNFGLRDAALAKQVEGLIDRIKNERDQLAVKRAQLQQHLSQFSSGEPKFGLTAASRGGGFVTTSGGTGGGTGGRHSSPLGQADSDASNGRANKLNSNNQFSDAASRSGSSIRTREVASNSQSRTRASSGTGFGGNASSNGQQGSSAGSGSAGGQSAEPGQAAVGVSGAPQSLAKKRGRGWALPATTAGGTGYLRPITVVCSRDGLRLRNSAGRWRTIPVSDSMEQAVDQMVEEIWQRIDSWGIAGQGSYWKPQLRVVTESGGERRYAELQGLLNDSGLVVQRAER